MNKTAQALTCTAVAILGIVTLSASADANAVPGFGGQAVPPSNAGCFSESFGVVTNSCATSGQYEWEVPLWVNGGPQNYYPYALVYNGGQTVGTKCVACARNLSNLSVTCGSWQYCNSEYTYCNLSLGPIAISDASLYAACLMAEGDTLYSVTW